MSNILKFFVKRVAVFYGTTLIVCLAIRGQQLVMVTALTAGVLLSLFKFAVLESVFGHLIGTASKKQAVTVSLVIYLLNLVIIGITAVFAMQFGVYALGAAMAGILSVLIIVMINAVTEAFGITKNHYGQKVK